MASVYARGKALNNALRAPDQAPTALLAGCESAVALAELDLPSLGITRLGSRNTLFKYADLVLGDSKTPEGESGWAYLDWLRRQVKKAAAQNKITGKQSTAAVQARAKVRQARVLDERKALEIALSAQSMANLWLIKEISAIAHNASGKTEKLGQQLFDLLDRYDEHFGYLYTGNLPPPILPNNPPENP